MSAVKIFGLVIVSLILFLSLNIFGIAFLVDRTVLNADFISDEFERLDLASVVSESVSGDSGLTPEMAQAVTSTVAKLQPHLEQALRSGLNDVYDYLRGNRDLPQLATVLRNSFFDPDFLVAIIEELDITTTIRQVVEEQLENATPVPAEMAPHLADLLAEFLSANEPWLKNELKNAAGGLADYFLGLQPGFQVSISIQPLLEDLEQPLYDLFMEYPPIALEGFPLSMLEAEFARIYQQVISEIPATIQIDESFIGSEVPRQVTTAINDAETALAELKTWVGYFQTAYLIIIIIIVVLAGIIVLICRAVRCSTRALGIVFLCYGTLTIIGVVIGTNAVTSHITSSLSGVPGVVQVWLPQFINNLLGPLRAFAIGCIAGGVVLLVVSFLYRRQPADTQEYQPEVTLEAN